MRLPRPFFQLPIQVDADRLQTEVAALPPAAWGAHPDRLPGNTAAQLICPQGVATASLRGPMLPTRWLAAMPYVRQILANLGVVWSRCQLMRLAPGAEVPDHADINHHWHTRVRVHIPVVTWPQVRFHCGGEAVHMAVGEAWIFDNWRRHRVANDAVQERIHLVADTTGSAAFWQSVLGPPVPRERRCHLVWQPASDARPMTEADPHSPVMPAAEVQLLLADFCAELAAFADSPKMRERAGRLSLLLENFVHDWRQGCARYGTGGAGRPEFTRLARTVHEAAKPLAEGLIMRTNGVRALHVLEARVLKHLLPGETAARVTTGADRRLERPVFIVGAPRSGSTLLFETLACSPAFNTFGGEAHWLVEEVAALRPGAPGIDSNRLTAAQATPEVIAFIRQAALARLRGPGSAPPAEGARLLEKTPKNALRIPFLKQVFPDACFIFVWREPCGNLGSIMEAWRSGGWITYSSLPAWEGPWSLLLPPDWQSLRGASLASIAARQWRTANETALDDLQWLQRKEWTAVGYHEFLADPAATVRRLCEFLGVPFDHALRARTAGALPPSRSTHTPAAPDKWRRDEAAIAAVLPSVDHCAQRLHALGSSTHL